jgi:hypothetical protein
MIGRLSLSMRFKASKKAPHRRRDTAENFGRFR